jgi:hypothetical protein
MLTVQERILNPKSLLTSWSGHRNASAQRGWFKKSRVPPFNSSCRKILRRKREGKQRKIIALMSNLIGTEILYCP